MEKIFRIWKKIIHNANNFKILGKYFQKEDLINKVLRLLNRSWQPKLIAISKTKDLSYMDLAILFDKLQEHKLS